MGAWRWWIGRLAFVCTVLVLLLIGLFGLINPLWTPYMISERLRLGELDRQWAYIDDMARSLPASAVAAEDAGFCRHFGLDFAAIRQVVVDGEGRGASTISQQVVKNVYLWQGRSWARKALEAVLTPLLDLLWTKRRIIEVYLNVAEFDAGVFGVAAGSRHYFGVTVANLTKRQSALLVAMLPDPKRRSAARPGPFVSERAGSIMRGAEVILQDGRADCVGPGQAG